MNIFCNLSSADNLTSRVYCTFWCMDSKELTVAQRAARSVYSDIRSIRVVWHQCVWSTPVHRRTWEVLGSNLHTSLISIYLCSCSCFWSFFLCILDFLFNVTCDVWGRKGGMSGCHKSCNDKEKEPLTWDMSAFHISNSILSTSVNVESRST